MAALAFKEAFPKLKISERLSNLLDRATVERVTINEAKDALHVYLCSQSWIGKAYIYELEAAIARDVFAESEMTVTVVERFELSASYTPENFYDVYKESMLLELRTVSPLLQQTFSRAKISFEEDHMVKAVLPENMVSENKRQDVIAYLEKVFNERAGFGVPIDVPKEMYKVPTKRRKLQVELSDEAAAVMGLGGRKSRASASAGKAAGHPTENVAAAAFDGVNAAGADAATVAAANASANANGGASDDYMAYLMQGAGAEMDAQAQLEAEIYGNVSAAPAGAYSDDFFFEDDAIEKRVREVMAKNEERKEKTEEKEAKLPTKKGGPRKAQKINLSDDSDMIFGRNFEDEPMPISELSDETKDVVIKGEICGTTEQTLRNGRII
ncbi:MAG: hypothetical protein KBS83_06230, partial [Lachnospiraceae bacterium]|nr:hypothetical protein [Candidatus Equihabitans merdae]